MIILVVYMFTKRVEKFTITRPSKCFSCEKDIINRENIWSVWKALPTKCFDCENNNKTIHPYMTGPTKCNDCDCDYFKNNENKTNTLFSWFN